jgi:hypothetical protein
MARTVVTAAANVALPYQPSGTSGLNSRTIVASGTLVLLNDAEFAALSATAFSGGTLLDGGDPTAGGGSYVTKSLSPSNATVDLFNVSGLVRIRDIVGRVTTVMSGTATTVKLAFDATVTAAVTDLAAANTTTSDPLGTLYSLVGDAAATAAAESAGIYLLTGAHIGANGIILPAGKIQMVGTAANTGVIEWTVVYQAIASGAVITAA